jgi:hypothetical protein
LDLPLNLLAVLVLAPEAPHLKEQEVRTRIETSTFKSLSEKQQH